MSGFERAHTSAHYTKRTNLTIQQLKTTLLGDTATNAVLDNHVTTTRKHDTQIAPQVVKRNADSIAVLTGDRGDDDQKLRRLARNHDIRPVIKHRECTSLQKAWNTRLDSDPYHRRNMNETANGDQTEFRTFCAVTPLVEAVPRTHHRVRGSQSGAKPRYFIQRQRLAVNRKERTVEYRG